MLDSIIVGKVIRKFREDKGLSQEVVSGFADIGRTHLSAIERGTRKPTLETFCRIGEALNVNPSVILKAIEEKNCFCPENLNSAEKKDFFKRRIRCAAY